MIFEFGKHMVASRHVVKMRLVLASEGPPNSEPLPLEGRRIEMMLSGAGLLIYEAHKTEGEATARMLEIAEWIGND